MIRTGKLGKGTYGRVYKAKLVGQKSGKDNGQSKPKQELAVKRNIVDVSTSFSGSLKELDMLHRLSGHPYVVNLLYVSFGNPFPIPNSPLRDPQGNFKEDYLFFVFEKAELDGHSLIQAEDIHVSYLKLAMVQSLLGLEYMHGKDIMHRDIKPANLLWFNDNKDNESTDNFTVKLCDFGLAKMPTKQTPESPRVVTSWYRAPEVCMEQPHYTSKIDLWAMGCIFVEMVNKKPLLEGSRDDNERLLQRIVNLVPVITEQDVSTLKQTKVKLPTSSSSLDQLLDLSPEQIEEFNRYPGEETGATYDQFIDLLNNLLVFNPDKRLSASQALDHPFFKPYQEIIDRCRHKYPIKNISTDNLSVDIHACKEREWAIQLAYRIFNGRSQLDWYRHRVLFQSIDLFDRYLHFLVSEGGGVNGEKEVNGAKEGKERSGGKYKGRYMSKYDTELRYLVCLYMSIKYFSSLTLPISFTDLASDSYKTEKALLASEQFERTLVKEILKFAIYRPTMFELADQYDLIWDEYQLRDLLIYVGQIQTPQTTSYQHLLDHFLTEVLKLPIPILTPVNSSNKGKLKLNVVT